MYTLILVCEDDSSHKLLTMFLSDWHSVVFWTKLRSTQTCYSKWWFVTFQKWRVATLQHATNLWYALSIAIICFFEHMHTDDTIWVAELKLEQGFHHVTYVIMNLYFLSDDRLAMTTLRITAEWGNQWVWATNHPAIPDLLSHVGTSNSYACEAKLFSF